MSVPPPSSSPFILNCSACLKPANPPVLLNCLHSVCSPCFERFSKDLTKVCICPACQTPFKKDERNPYLVQSRVEPEFDPNHIECVSCENDAVESCNDCRDYYCGDCKANHLGDKRWKTHQFAPITHESLQNGPVKPVDCTIHKTTHLSLLCLPCKEVICQECLVDSHSSHQIQNLSDASARYRKQITTDLLPIVAVQKSLTEKIDLARQAHEWLDRNVKGLEEQIHQDIDAKIAQLRHEEAKLLQELEQQRHQKGKALDLHNEELQFNYNAMNASIAVGNALAEDPVDAAVAFGYMALQTRLTTLRTHLTKSPSLPNTSLSFGTFSASGLITPKPLQASLKPDYKNINKALVVFGAYGSENGNFKSASSVCATPTCIFVADMSLDRIQAFDYSGRFLFKFGCSGRGNGEFNLPKSMQFSNNELFVADSANNRIQVFDEKGNFLRSFGSLGNEKELYWPCALCFDAEGNLLIADSSNLCIQSFTREGKHLRTIKLQHGEKSFFSSSPVGLGFLSNNTIVISYASKNIVAFDLDGGEPLWKNTLCLCSTKICIDPYDNILVSDYEANKVRILNQSGLEIGAIENLRSSPNEFVTLLPKDICLDSKGRPIISSGGRIIICE